MPKSAQYRVGWSSERAGYLLTEQEKGGAASWLGDEVSWLQWLEEHHAFAFRGRNGHCNLLKERRRRGDEGYWYAYRRHDGQMIKRYVGRSEQVSMERLEEIAALLTHEASASQADQPARAVSTPHSAQHGASGQSANGVEEGDGDVPAPAGGTQSQSMSDWSSLQFEPLLMPKLQLPRLQTSLLPRPRLLDLLDKGLAGKLTLIAGPAGYGKTTLVGQWIAERGRRPDFPRVAYVGLDEGDNDPIRFWRYVIAACQNLHPGFGKEALKLLLAHRLPPFKPLKMMLTALLNELSRLERPAVLILDDLHTVRSPQVAETLGFFLDHLPTSFHMIILLRGDPPLPLARLRARNELLDIYPPHLGFSLEETRAFFEQELPFSLSSKLLLKVFERMDAWPAGLRLLARELHVSDNEQEIEQTLESLAGSYWSIQEYFLTEVLHLLPEEQQEFLLHTCILPRITAPLCDTIMERNDSAVLIDALRGGDFFLIPLDGRGEWARYHSLFAEAMQQEARRQLGEACLHQLSLSASIWYEEHELSAEAIETALNAAECIRAAGLIEQFIQSKEQSTTPTIPEYYDLKRWLERLPQEELERNPILCLHYAMTLLVVLMQEPRFSDGKERIQRLLQLAEQKWRDANNTARLAEVFAFRALLARQDGRMLQAVTWARQALAWLPSENRTWRNLSLSVVGVGELLDGNLNTAREDILEALRLSEQQGNIIYMRATRGMLCGVSLEQGELRRTAEQFRQIQVEARVQEDRDDIAHTQLGLAQIAYQRNHLEEAEQAAREALEIGEQTNLEEFHAQATARLALIEHAGGQAAQAQQRLISWLARAQPPISPYSYQLARVVQSTLAYVQLAGGDLAAVERWFGSIERQEEVLPTLQRRREQVLRARLHLAQGELSTAIEKLESVCAATLQTGHLYLRSEAQVVLVLAYARQGEHAKAHELLHDLLAATHNEGYLRLFLDEGKELAALLRGLLPHLHEKPLQAYAQHILSAFAHEIDMPDLEGMGGPSLLQEPLSRQEQKVLRLLAAGNSNTEIARELVVSVNTVRTQVQSIYRKLNVNNRMEAREIARQLQLL